MEFTRIIGNGCTDMYVHIRTREEEWVLRAADLHSQGDGRWTASHHGMQAVVCTEPFDGGTAFYVSLESAAPLGCQEIAICLSWPDKIIDTTELWAPSGGADLSITGLHRIEKGGHTPPDTILGGVFAGYNKPSILLGTVFPQTNRHLYHTEYEHNGTFILCASTHFNEGQSGLSQVRTETTRLICGLCPVDAMEAYAAYLPIQDEGQLAAPLIGWNSWDYYASTVTHEDSEENMRFIQGDPVLRERIRCIIIDDGWQHREGDWYANFKFPRGMAYTARRIRENGFVPGIWTSCEIHSRSGLALRNPQVLIKNTDGTPLSIGGMYMVDPTHPDAQEYLFSLYRRLYDDGFRIFKVDFVSQILRAQRFYQEGCGIYDAVRTLFSIVRRAVGQDSHLLGCAFPWECGPGIVNSSRISVDIHNQWPHILWILECLQSTYWMNARLFRIDPDFLIVRGSDTSDEPETNVYNPIGHLPWEPDGPRWRRGTVFTALEAETWANIVSFAGGNVLLSDRLSRLNRRGLAMLHAHTDTAGIAARPIDLGSGRICSLWHLHLADTENLLVINITEDAQSRMLDLAALGFHTPQSVHTDKSIEYQDGRVILCLAPHESAVLSWDIVSEGKLV